jgi:hypothetical protein
MRRKNEMPKLTREEIMNDPFAKGMNLDLSGYLLPDQTPAALPVEAHDKNGFNRVDFRQGFSAPSVEEMLANPETREALAERDSNFREQYAEEMVEKVCSQFLQKYPDYLDTGKNYKALVQEMAAKLLKNNRLSDEDAERELLETGHWTVDQMSNCYRYLLKAGKLDVPRGTIRTLTESEKLELISQIRTGALDEAVLNYVSWSLGGLGDYSSVSKLFAENPEIVSIANEFCFWHSKAGTIDAAEYNRFKAERLAGHKILTYRLIFDAYDAWKKSNKHSFLFPDQSTAPEVVELPPQNFEDLNDEELADLLQRSKLEQAKNARIRR